MDVLVDGRPKHVLGLPDGAAGEWAWGGGEFFAGTVERLGVGSGHPREGRPGRPRLCGEERA